PSLDSLFTNFFNWKFFEKTFTLQFVNDAFVKITLDLKVSFGAAALLLHLLQNSAQTGAPHARRKAKNTGVDIQVLFDDFVILQAQTLAQDARADFPVGVNLIAPFRESLEIFFYR